MHPDSMSATVQRQILSFSRTNSLRLLFLAMLLASALCSIASAQVTTCTTGALPAGTGGDLIVSGPGTCTVSSGTYQYHNVNVILGGTLLFTDTKIDFWAESILVENTGSLIAGSKYAPIGTYGGQVTLHLYGRDQGTTGTAQGIVCQTPTSDTVGPCGVPMNIWTSNVAMGIDPTSCAQNALPGGVTDCFYQYMPLDYDGGGNPPGYFGYKVLALSYGGTLQLFGAKGATYSNLQSSSSGTSWGRLNGSLSAGATTLVMDRKVNWQVGDQIVLTTTDYLPGHSEQLTICSIGSDQKTIGFTLTSGNPCGGTVGSTGLSYNHNGETYNLNHVPAGIGPDPDKTVVCSSGQTRCVETRAAVGLLTRSIQIVSGGDFLGKPFPSDSGCQSGTPPTCSSKPGKCYFFGGHTLVRQGFQSYQVQGVEFYQLGQGGRIMHYPVHFHMARQTPANTFVADSSVWDSMTRWYTIHATEGVTLARNVGFLSIGHGYYLEDGTETDNKLLSNLGVMARAAVVNGQNPRCVPGILAATHQVGQDQVPYSTDMDHPTSFWIMNGWNDFQYNMAAGAAGCGMCYWLTSGGNSGNSRCEYWGTGYAAEQEVTQPLQGATCSNQGGAPDVWSRAGTSPLKSFVGNSCVSAQEAFFTISNSTACYGIVPYGDGGPTMPAIDNPLAPAIGSSEANNYYPKVAQGASRTPTLCPPGQDCSCSTTTPCTQGGENGVPVCGGSAAGQPYCTVTALDHFTTSFNWAQTGFAALWLRQQWYLVSNSAISDVQNGGLTFISGGGYTNSDEVPGYWALAHKNAFIGSTQPKNPFALNAGPFNIYSRLKCAPLPSGGNETNYCINADEGISMSLSNFGMNQRFFNIYDGPSFQDSNAYLDINKTTLAGCNTANGGYNCESRGWMYGNVTGIPLDPTQKPNFQAYLPNAAIAWKQPNGFYYPPEFHSRNLFFDNVDIRHFVIEPLFHPGTYDTDGTQVVIRYFNNAGGTDGAAGMFNGFTDIDRQTELSDDDGSLTGLLGAAQQHTKRFLPAISVNKDTFFSSPVETVECASDIPDILSPGQSCPYSDPDLCGTANTSPYDYVTTVVYPGTSSPNCTDIPNWDQYCENANCFGVRLYREDLVPSDLQNKNLKPFIRMAGQQTCQRSSLTVNNGNYYMDTGASLNTQNSWNEFGAPAINVFMKDTTYYTFLLYAKPTTAQTYSMYVGTDFNPADTGQLWVTRVDKGQVPYTFTQDTTDTITACSSQRPASDFAWCYDYDATSGVLSVTMNMGFSEFKQDYAKAIEEHCQPQSYCSWNGTSKSCGCALKSSDPGYNECQNACSNWATKSIDCPWDSTTGTGGCYGFGVALQDGFVANDQPAPTGSCLTNNPPWNVPFAAASLRTAGKCFYPTVPVGTYCSSGRK